jgi:hypothetical protein
MTFVAEPGDQRVALTMQTTSRSRARRSPPRPGRCLPTAPRAIARSIVWALSQAGKYPTDALVEAGSRAGYNLEVVRGQIEMLARR